jgi:transmembrane sensor
MAASVLIALLVGSIFFELQRREAAATVYATRSGERRIIQLADGSQLVLNYATALDVRFSDHDRRLRLHKGEALFTVAHDATRPFKVDAGDGVVTALGTRFEVRTDADQVAVTLLEGRVSVDRRHVNAHVELEPGDQVHFEETSAQMTRRKVDTEFVTSWSTGRLRFRATPLAEVLDEVNRYSTTQIRIVDTTLGSIPISGTFEIGDTASVVAALNALLPIEATAKDREIQLRRRN